MSSLSPLLFFGAVSLASAAPALLITDERLHPLRAELFGQFLERPSWSGERGPEAVCDEQGRLPPAVETALAALRAPVVRFPFGTDGDYLDWQDLIDLPHRASRPPSTGHKGGTITNRFGYAEYFKLATRLGWRTVLVANLRDALYRKKPLPEAAAHAAALLRYGLDHAAPGAIAAFQIGNEGWFYWPPPPEQRAALGLADEAACAAWLRECLLAYAEAARAVDPSIPLICDAPRPLDGGGLENNAASVWRAAVDDDSVRARYAMLASHSYSPMGLWTVERGGAKTDASALSPDEIWLAAVSALGRFDAQGQAVADHAAYEEIAALGYDTAVTEWNWNVWDWAKRFPHAGFGDGVPAALNAASFLHGLMRHPRVSLATQSVMLGTAWGITGVRVSADGSVAYLPQAEAVRLHAEHRGAYVVKSRLDGAEDLGAAPRLASWWPPVERVARLDAIVSADARAWYVHLVHRHRVEPIALRIETPAPAGAATLHLLTGAPEATTTRPGGFARSAHPVPPSNDGALQTTLPPASVAVLVIPRVRAE